MISKIYKISFILIFMLFSTCLFNFCFAFEITDYSSSCFTLSENEFGYDVATIDNIDNFVPFSLDSLNMELSSSGTTLSSTLLSYLNSVVTYWSNESVLDKPIIYYIVINEETSNYWLYCDVPWASEDKLNDSSFMSSWSDPYIAPNYKTRYQHCSFKFIDGQWYYMGNLGSTFRHHEGINNEYKITNYGNFTIVDSSENILFQATENNLPTNEELVTNCDFKVNFKFAPKSEDFPSDNVGTRWSWACRLLLQHSMTNWNDNYNVKVKLSVINKTQPNGLYYDLYNSNGEEIQKKKHIKEEILTEEINNGDFFLMFTDNLQDTFKLEYEIYNKSNELLIKKIYTFKFTKSGLTYYNSTGTIIEEQTQDSNGNDISSENNSFDTNGYDNTNNNNNDDYYDVSNLDSLVSGASDTINLAKQCFSVLPGFIWVMVGVFLSVCIALRILGR